MIQEKSQLKIGVVLNYVNMIAGSLIPLFYLPVMLQLLGQNEYGLYKLAANISSFLNLVSMGLGSAVSRYLIKAQVEEGKEAEERVLGLFMLIFQVVAVVAFVIGGILTLNLGIWYSESLTPDELTKMKIIVFILTCSTSLSFAVSPYVALVSTHERFLFMQSMNIVSTCLGPTLNLIVLFLGFKSVGMAASSLVLSLLVQLAYVIYIRKTLRIAPRFRDMPTNLLKEIIIFSFWIFVANVVNQLYTQTDAVMIGSIPALGTAGVAVYNIGATFSGMVLTLTIGISSLLGPRTNKLVFSGASKKELTDYSIRYGRLQELIAVAVTCGFIAFGEPFIVLYAGEEYKIAYWVALVVMIPNLIPLAQSVCLAIIVAQNKHRFRSLVYLGIAIGNVICTWFLMQTELGIVGAALATGVALVIGQGFIMNWYYAKVIGLEIGRFWKDVGTILPIPILLSILFLMLSAFIDFYTWPTLIAGVASFVAAYIILMWTFSLSKYEKDLVMSLLTRLKK